MIGPMNLIIVILFFAGIIWLQVFLSKKESKVLGLILPIISFLYSLLIVFNMVLMGSMSSGDLIGAIVSTLLLANIPTIIFLAIYIACRKDIKKNKEIEKMKIQDL